MGCGFSDANWQDEMEEAEEQMYRLTPGLDMDKLTRKYVLINMEGETLAVRTAIYNDDRSKKTLLMTHGYCMAAPFHSHTLPALAEHYRIVMFDNLGWGLNTRTMNVGDALESPEKAERYMVTWWEKYIEALGDDLPAKFYLSGHSAGGYQCMLYACHHPERLEGLFFMSTASADEQNADFVYDPYSIRIQDQKDELPSRADVDKQIANYAANKHLQADAHSAPYFMVKGMCKKEMRKMHPEAHFSNEFCDAAGLYYGLMLQRWGMVEVVLQRTVLWFDYLYRPLHTPERMLQDFDFPIAYCNGTRDFFGNGDGANTVVKNNRYFESGRSQLFKLENSGHNVFLDNPHQLTTYMIGFFEGTITHTFDLKPRKEFTPDKPAH